VNKKNKSSILNKIELKSFEQYEDGLKYIDKKSTEELVKSIVKKPVKDKEEYKELKEFEIIGKTHTFYPPLKEY
jgi:hypothetical protein